MEISRSKDCTNKVSKLTDEEECDDNDKHEGDIVLALVMLGLLGDGTGAGKLPPYFAAEVELSYQEDVDHCDDGERDEEDEDVGESDVVHIAIQILVPAWYVFRQVGQVGGIGEG